MLPSLDDPVEKLGQLMAADTLRFPVGPSRPEVDAQIPLIVAPAPLLHLRVPREVGLVMLAAVAEAQNSETALPGTTRLARLPLLVAPAGLAPPDRLVATTSVL